MQLQTNKQTVKILKSERKRYKN